MCGQPAAPQGILLATRLNWKNSLRLAWRDPRTRGPSTPHVVRFAKARSPLRMTGLLPLGSVQVRAGPKEYFRRLHNGL